ncbi:uncharacterized protein LOC117619923 [Prunus dulcis]|uniref:uncharacterized protein LOC117619923 n=1 Tax=Prunus dulcis TaxID=3755 RepID=UPI0014826039|nr:uncharacterized protein LOC117619923 [Prunus dulcis]
MEFSVLSSFKGCIDDSFWCCAMAQGPFYAPKSSSYVPGGQYLHCQTLNIDDFQFTVLWNKRCFASKMVNDLVNHFSEKDQLLPKGRVWVSVQDSKRLKCCDSRQRCLKE